MPQFLERPPNISGLARSNTWKEIDISTYINMGYLPSSATGLILAVRSQGTGEFGVRPAGSCRLVTGTATGGATNKLIDTTKNFVALGITVGREVHKDADGKWGTITSITTTTNPNDTLNYTAGAYAPTFAAGNTYYVTFNFKENISGASGEMFYIGMSSDKKIEVYYDAGGYTLIIEIFGYFDCEGVMFDGVPSGTTPFTKFSTSGGADGWQTFDLSSYVTSVAKAALFIKCSSNTYGVAPKFGVRKYGSTYDNKSLCNEVFGFIAPLDGSQRCQMYRSASKVQDFYLVGFLVTGVFKDNPEEIRSEQVYISGTATGGSTTRLIDTTKNFARLYYLKTSVWGLGPSNMVLRKLSDGKYADTYYGGSWSFSTTVATQIVSGTCTGMPNRQYTKVIDTTKNFLALGVVPGHFVLNTYYPELQWQITSITTTTNPNDTLRFEITADNYGANNYFDNGSAYQVWTGNKYDTINFPAGGNTPTFSAGDSYTFNRWGGWNDIDRISDPDLPEHATGVICHSFNDVAPGSWTGGAVRQRPQGTYSIARVLGTNGNQYDCIRSHISSPDTRPVTGAAWSSYWTLHATPASYQYTAPWQDDHHYEYWLSDSSWGPTYSTHGSSILISGLRKTLGNTYAVARGFSGSASINIYAGFVDAYGDFYFEDYGGYSIDTGSIFRIRNYAGQPWKSGEQELVTVVVNPYSDDFYPTGRCFGTSGAGSSSNKLVDPTKNFNTVASVYGVIGKRVYKEHDGRSARIYAVSSTINPYDTIHFYEHHGDSRYLETPVFGGAGENYEILEPVSAHINAMFDDDNHPDGFFVAAPNPTYNKPYMWYIPWVGGYLYHAGDMVSWSTSSYRCIVTHVSSNFVNDYNAGKWIGPAEGGSPIYRVDKETGNYDLWIHQSFIQDPDYSGRFAFNPDRDSIIHWTTWANYPSLTQTPGFVEITRGLVGPYHDWTYWIPPYPPGGSNNHYNVGCFNDGRITLYDGTTKQHILYSGYGLGGHIDQYVVSTVPSSPNFSTADNAGYRMFSGFQGATGNLYECWDIVPNTVKQMSFSGIATWGGRQACVNPNDRLIYEMPGGYPVIKTNWDTGEFETWDSSGGSGGNYSPVGGTYFLREEPTPHVFQAIAANTSSKIYLMGYCEPCFIPGPPDSPDPYVGEICVPIDKVLTWEAGIYATSHNVYFGTSYPPSEVSHGQLLTSYTPPGGMLYDTTYYWRIDEVNIYGTTVGPNWNFHTAVEPPGKASNPDPANMEANVIPTHLLTWTSTPEALRHRVHFGHSYPPSFVGEQVGTTYDPGVMEYSTLVGGVDTPSYYYWRIDDVDACDTTSAGDEWTFQIKYIILEDLLVDATAIVELEEIYFKNEIIFSFDNTPVLIDSYVNLSIRGKQLSGAPNTFQFMVAIKLCDDWFVLQPSYVCDYFILTPTYFAFPSTWHTLYWEHIFDSKLTRAQINEAKIAIIPKDDLVVDGVAVSEIKLFPIEPAHEEFTIKLEGWDTHDVQHDDKTRSRYVKVYKLDTGGYGAGIFGFGLFGT